MTEQQKKQVDEKIDILKEADVWNAQLAHLDNCIAWEHVMEPKRAAEECQRQLDGKAKEKAEEVSLTVTMRADSCLHQSLPHSAAIPAAC